MDAITAKQQGALGAPHAPMQTAALSHADLVVARAAFAALESLEGGYVQAYSVALSRFEDDGVVVRRICAEMEEWPPFETLVSHQSVLIERAAPALTRVLSVHGNDARLLTLLCSAVSNLALVGAIEYAFVESGLLSAPIDLLPRHDSNAHHFVFITTAIWNTTCSDNGLSTGGPAATFAAFHKHNGSSSAAKTVLSAMASWSRTSDVYRAAIAAEGAFS